MIANNSLFCSRKVLCCIVLTFFPFFSLSCEKTSGSQPGFVPEVQYVLPEKKVVTYYDRYPARFVAGQKAEIRSRISGHIKEIHFVEGSYLEKGSLLFTVDPSEVNANSEVRESELKAASSEVRFAAANLARAKKLLESKAIAQEEFESRRRAVVVAKAARSAAKERLESSNSDLAYAYIKAPFSGRISDALVDPGNLTSPDVVLSTLASQNPIYVSFEIDEASSIRYRKLIPGFSSLLEGKSPAVPIGVEIDPGDGSGFTITGVLDFLDNSLDQNSGALRARATVENSKLILQPNYFAKLRIPLRSPEEVLLLPKSAVLSQQTSRSVYVVGDDDKVEIRKIILGAEFPESWEIANGLSATEKVIIDNLVMLGPGRPVKARSSSESSLNSGQ